MARDAKDIERQPAQQQLLLTSSMSRAAVALFVASLAISGVFLIDGAYSRAVPEELLAEDKGEQLLGYGFWFLWLPFFLAQSIVLFLLSRRLAGGTKSVVLALCFSVFVAASLYSYAGYESLKARVVQQ